MKKSFLVLAATLALGLAACNKPAPGPAAPSVPTEEGKVTFYFEMGAEEAAVAVPEYCNIFLTGAFCEWKTGADEAVVMTRLAEDSNIYYGQWTGDYTTLTDKGYQLTVGYSATSGSGSTGVNWSYKSVECKAGSGDSGTENLNFELSADGKTAALGSHHWEEVPGPVVVVEDITVSLTFAEAVPTWVSLFAPGNYRNNWACSVTEDAMTPSADRKTWTIHIDQQNLGTYEMKVIAEYADATAFSWKTTVLDNGEGGNFSLNILRANANGTIDLNERANDGNPLAFDWSVLPDPSALATVDAKFVIELSDTAYTDASVLGVAIKGSFDGWAAAHAMTVTSAAGAAFVFEFTYEDVLEGEYEFGFIEYDNAETLNQFAWHSGTDGQNIKVTIEAATTTYRFSGSFAAGIAAVPANA